MLVNCFGTSVAWNAFLLDRQSGDIIAGSSILRAAISRSAVFVRASSTDLDNLATVVRKPVGEPVRLST